MVHKIGIEEFNRRYAGLSPEERIARIYQDFDSSKILVTSSFGTSSVYLLDLIRKISPQQPVYFIDTGYHFEETLAYKRRLTQLFDLNVVDWRPEGNEHQFTANHQTWLSDPDLCCSINKVKPIDRIKANYEVWISGVSSHQTQDRGGMSIFQDKKDIIKFHPILDVTSEEIERHILHNNLPVHPLKFMGYNSVGCSHCTVKGVGRSGRWVGSEKTECGLHFG